MAISKELIDHLRSGGILYSENFIIASTAVNDKGVWVCGADYMTDKLVSEISDAAAQMIDATDGKGLFSFESQTDKYTTLSFDFESTLGDLSMRLRHPIWICGMQNKGGHQVDLDKNKVVPLPPEFESPCSALFKGQIPKMVFFSDGTFKLIKT